MHCTLKLQDASGKQPLIESTAISVSSASYDVDPVQDNSSSVYLHTKGLGEVHARIALAADSRICNDSFPSSAEQVAGRVQELGHGSCVTPACSKKSMIVLPCRLLGVIKDAVRQIRFRLGS